MSNKEKVDRQQGKDQESLVSSFHRVEKLVPVGQVLLTVPPELPVKEALKVMEKNHYSQLPVVAGRAVLGVFSHRSFADKALARQKSSKGWLGDLSVEDFLEDVEYARPAEDWNRVLRYLDRDDAFLVGHQDALDGLVTTMDVLHYFQGVANPFIMLAEIELSLRKIIKACVKGEELPVVLRNSLKNGYESSEASITLFNLTFYDYISIITSRNNWKYFRDFFGEGERVRVKTNEKLNKLREWRNAVFHFRETLEEWELNTLTEYRDWLHRRVRAYESRQSEKRTAKVPKTSSKKKRHKWTEEQFFNALEGEVSPEIYRSATDLYQWSKKASHRIWFGTGVKNGTFTFHYLRKGKTVSVFTIRTSGHLIVNFGWLVDQVDEVLIQEFHQKLMDIHPFRNIPTELNRWPSITLENFFEDASYVEQFEDLVKSFGQQVVDRG